MSDPSPTINKLLIVTHVRHYRHSNRLYAYGPYELEIEIWADLFPEILIAAPIIDSQPPGDCLPFKCQNIRVVPQMLTGGNSWQAKLYQVLALPRLIWELTSVMRQADAIHVRCPGNLGMLGAIFAPVFSRYLIAKYAGNWQGYPGESWTWRLQRAILSSAWWRGPVTVYGIWPNQPKNIIPFFTSIMSDKHQARARVASRAKSFGHPLRILYVGRLTKEKNVHKLLAAVGQLEVQSIHVFVSIVGEGPMRQQLEAQVIELGLQDRVSFMGGVSFEHVLDFYEQSDVLVLASETEGWPKAIAEAMAFGLICIGSDRGWVPEMLGEGRGIVVPPGDVNALVHQLRNIAIDPERYKSISIRASGWAEQYSLIGLREALRNLIAERWQVALEPPYQGVAI